MEDKISIIKIKDNKLVMSKYKIDSYVEEGQDTDSSIEVLVNKYNKTKSEGDYLLIDYDTMVQIVYSNLLNAESSYKDKIKSAINGLDFMITCTNPSDEQKSNIEFSKNILMNLLKNE